MVEVPEITFNDGNNCPVLGFGTWKSKPNGVRKMVERAIDLGYRHFDCAYVYGNEKQVGHAIKNKILMGTVKREDLFITSKLWNTFHHPADVIDALRESLQNLELSYLDLYLMHWPFAFKARRGLIPLDLDARIISDERIDFVHTWKAMEELQKAGMVKSIGVCNFNVQQIKRLLKYSLITPVVNQIESHPFLNQWKLAKFCKNNGILIASYHPYGHFHTPWSKADHIRLFEDEKLTQIANKHKKTVLQVLLRYQIDLSNMAIIRPLTESEMEDSINVFDFELSYEDMVHIGSLECNGRLCTFEGVTDHLYYPFSKNDAQTEKKS